MTDFLGPISHSFMSQRTRLHYLDWGNHGAPPLVLVHGGRDHARTWDWTAEALRHDYHIIVPDLRGHGDSDWSSDGAYGMASFVFDLAKLIDDIDVGPVAIVSHSLGGGISLRYAGLFPEKVSKLLAVEGIASLPDEMRVERTRPLNERLARWVEVRRHLSGRPAYRYRSLDEAIARMRQANGDLTAAQVRHLAVHAVRRNEDGSFSWKYDPYVRSQTPFVPADVDSGAIWARITCPVLLAWGRRSWNNTDPAAAGVVEMFPNARAVGFDGGHWLHHDCFDAFLDRTRRFLATGD